MNYTVVVFSSRSETMHFYKIIKNYGLFCSIINTPRPLSSSCGVSTKIDARLISNSINIVRQYKFATYKGIYNIELIKGKEIVTRVF